MDYTLSYKHNGADNNHKWSWGDKIAQKKFKTESEALEWIKNNSTYTPLKLLKWDDNIQCNRVVKEF